MLPHLLALALQVVSPSDLVGQWSGEVSHAGRVSAYALEIRTAAGDRLAVWVRLPAIHVLHQPLGEFEARAAGEGGREIELGWLGTLTLSADGRRLTGVVPQAFSPVHELAFALERVERLEFPERPPLDAPPAQPLWTHDAGAPAWPGATFAAGLVLVGVEDGRLLALDAASGEPRWELATGARVRSRATVEDDSVYLHSDDGWVYALELATGARRWRVRVETEPIVRRPFDDPKSRFDRFGSAVTSRGARLYVGTHDGRVLALDAADGATLWSHTAGECVLAAPAVDTERVYFGGFDGLVRSLDVATGAQLWERDALAPIVSTPALAGERVIVGSRSYDLFGLEAASGQVAWQHYLWFSWIESSAVVRDGVACVGSSDAAVLAAHDARTGELRWSTHVHGWAWGEPAVGETRVYVGTCGQGGYLAPHQGGLIALERASGKPVWRFAAPSNDETYGFPGSPALGAGRVFAAGLDGKVRAFVP